MTKTAKILITLISLFLVFVIYLIASTDLVTINETKPAPVQTSSVPEAEPVDLERLALEYRAGVKLIFADLMLLTPGLASGGEPAGASSTDLSATGTAAAAVTEPAGADAVLSIKDRLMGLTVPPEFKDLHLDLVFAVSRIAAFLDTGFEPDKSAGLEELSSIQAEYPWLSSPEASN